MRAATVRQGRAAAKPRERVKGALVAPEFTLKLMEHVGPTAAAKLIGTTPGTLHKARNAAMISQPLEVAARGVWHEKGYSDMERAQSASRPRTADLGEATLSPTAENTVLMLVQVPRGHEAIIEKTVQAIGGTVAVQT